MKGEELEVRSREFRDKMEEANTSYRARIAEYDTLQGELDKVPESYTLSFLKKLKLVLYLKI